MKGSKRFLSFAVMALVFVFTACKKDEASESPIAGRWIVQRIYTEMTHNNEVIMTTEQTQPPGVIKRDFIEFRADGSFTADIRVVSNGHWVINDNKLHLTGSEQFELSDDGFDILKLTKNELTFTDTYFPVFEEPEATWYEGATIEITYYLER